MFMFKNKSFSRESRIACLCVILCDTCFAVDSVVPDGTTDTSVSTQDGRVIVDIAEPDTDRVSVNRYTTFNVPESGVALDNREKAARTIVNDVTGYESSLIEGELEVLGTRAHVVVANRHGIKVDGGRFVNNADLVLSTGTVGRVDRLISEGVIQSNITLDTQGGEIVIGEGGLSGAFSTLDIISESMKVNGSVVNTNPGLKNVVRFSPGGSISELDTSLSPNSPVRSLAAIDQQNLIDSDQAILFEVTQDGSVSSGSISVAITEEGAGFRNAGNLNALSGDVDISLNGLLDMAGGNIVAQRHVKIDAENVDISQREIDGDISQSVIQAKEGAVVLTTNELNNKGGVIRGNKRDEEDEKSNGGVTIYANEINNSSQSSSALSVIFSEDDDLYVESESLTNNTGRIVSNGQAIFNVGHFYNHIDVSDFEGIGEWVTNTYTSKRLWYTFFTKKEKITEKTIDYGVGRLGNNIAFITGDEGVEISAKSVVNRGGEINSNNGDVSINTSTLDNSAQRVGKASLVTKCGFRCTSSGSSSVIALGGNINAGGSLSVDASEYVKNIGGQMLGIDDLNITSPDISAQSYQIHNVTNRDRGIAGLDYDKAFIYSQDQGGSFISNMGDINFDTLGSVEIDGGFVSAGSGVVNGDVNILRDPVKENVTFGEHIGHFEGLLN